MTADLLSPRTGLIRFLHDVPTPEHFPVGFQQVASGIARTAPIVGTQNDAQGAGYAIDDRAAAAAGAAAAGAAVGEAVERYCSFIVPTGLPLGSARELALTRDLPAPVEPSAWALFSAEQYAEPAFPFVPFTPEHRTTWAVARDLRTGEEALVPASMAWAVPPPAAGPPLHGVLQAGLAAGRSWEQAVFAGLCEVIERDAMTLCWYGRRGLIELDPGPALEQLAQGPEGRLDASWWSFPHEFGPPLVGVFLTDRTTGLTALGMGCRAHEVGAARKALTEACQLLALLGDYDDPAGAFAAAASKPTSPLVPWRADRAYGAAYGDGLTGARDYGCHLQLALDPHIRDQINHWLQRLRLGERPLTERGPAVDLPAAAALVHKAGHQVLVVDLTTPDVAACGLTVVRVLVPGLYGNAAIGRPMLGGTRLADALNGDLSRRTPVPLPH